MPVNNMYPDLFNLCIAQEIHQQYKRGIMSKERYQFDLPWQEAPTFNDGTGGSLFFAIWFMMPRHAYLSIAILTTWFIDVRVVESV